MCVYSKWLPQRTNSLSLSLSLRDQNISLSVSTKSETSPNNYLETGKKKIKRRNKAHTLNIHYTTTPKRKEKKKGKPMKSGDDDMYV